MRRLHSSWGKLALVTGLAMGLFMLLYCSREHSNPLDPASTEAEKRPEVPAGLNATDGVGRITVQWQMVQSEDVVGYGVYRSERSNGIYAFLPGDGDSAWAITTGQTSYVDSLFGQSAEKTNGARELTQKEIANKFVGEYGRLGKHAGSGRVLKTYYYKVKAVGQNNIQGNFSPYTYASLLADEVPPEMPGEIMARADAEDPGVVHLSWRAPEWDADGGELTGLVAGYRVYRSESLEGVYLQIGEVSSETYTDRGRRQVTIYYYKLTAYDASGNESEKSAARSVRTSGVQAPTSVTAQSSESASGPITVSWYAVNDPDVIGYLVYRSMHPVTGFSPIERIQVEESRWITTSQTSYEDTDVEWQTIYYYTVTAITSIGFESERSMLVSALAE